MHERYTLLIVDDSETNLMLLDAILKTYFQHRVLTAKNAQEALKLIQITDIDIVLTDINMPLMNGYELAQKIKASLDTQHIHIFFVSSVHATDADKRMMDEVGAIGYIEKPIRTSTLKMQLEDCFRMIASKKHLSEI